MSAIIAFKRRVVRASWRSPSMPANQAQNRRDLWFHLAPESLCRRVSQRSSALSSGALRTRVQSIPSTSAASWTATCEPSRHHLRPVKPIRFEPLGEQAQARTVPPDNLYPICSLCPENVERAPLKGRSGVAHQRSQPIRTLAEIDRSGRSTMRACGGICQTRRRE